MPKMRKKDRDNVLRMIHQSYINEEIKEKTGVSLPTIRAIRKEVETGKKKIRVFFDQVYAFDDMGIEDEGGRAITLKSWVSDMWDHMADCVLKIKSIEKFLKKYGYEYTEDWTDLILEE